jgi:hypothetical protein
MQKIIEETNAITWFEIPVTDMNRAVKFYETILDIKMDVKFMEETNEEVSFFPFTGAEIRATSGRVSGVLVRNNRTEPSGKGITVYLNANPSIQEVIAKVEPAGGKIILAKTKIQAGCVAMIFDTEGNRVGLFANA